MRVVDVSRSHRVHRVAAGDGRGFVVKARDRTASSRTLDNELYVYRLASWSEPLAEVLPRPLLIDERHQVLVFEAAAEEQGIEDLLVRRSAPTPAMVWALGRAIGTWHGSTRGLPLPPTAGAGAMHLPETDADHWSIRTPTARRLAHEILSEDLLREALTDAAGAWSPSGLVHGDLKWDNCRLNETSRPPRVRVIDWEMAGLGDPAWDLGCVVAEQIGLALGRDPADERQGFTAAVGAAGPLAEGFTSIMGKPDQELWDRTARCAAVRLVHLALECAEFGGEASTGRTERLTRAAKEILVAHDGVEAALAHGTD